MKSMDTPPTAGSRHASSDAHVIVQSRSPRQVAQIEPACSVLHSASDLHGSFGCSSGFGAAADAGGGAQTLMPTAPTPWQLAWPPHSLALAEHWGVQALAEPTVTQTPLAQSELVTQLAPPLDDELLDELQPRSPITRASEGMSVSRRIMETPDVWAWVRAPENTACAPIATEKIAGEAHDVSRV